MTAIFEKIDPLTWLKQYKNHPHFYWKSDSEEIAAVGIADVAYTIEQVQERLEPGVRYYGGFNFSEELSWQRWPRCCFIRPQLEISGNVNTTCSSCPLPKVIGRADLPNKKQWLIMVNRALQNITNNNIQKVVLARRATLKLSDAVDGLSLLQCLQSNFLRAYYYYFDFGDGRIFLGATPERLFKRDGRVFFTEAMAGTRWGGERFSKKECAEHTCVVEDVRNFLSEVAVDFIESGVEEIKYGDLSHLYLRFNGFLKDNFGDLELLKRLHPTSAVGGRPRGKALELIKILEPFNRGWYAAPVGFLSNDKSEFVVGLRSALVRGDEIDLFAGCGIVEGSDPEVEWEELERKISLFVEILT